MTDARSREGHDRHPVPAGRSGGGRVKTGAEIREGHDRSWKTADRPKVIEDADRRRHREALEAAVLALEGRTVAEVATALRLPRSTAWRRIRAGKAFYAAATRSRRSRAGSSR